MASPIFLSRTADKLRSDLAEWARETAKQGQDYLVNEKGDRIYHKQKNSHLVNPLLKDMGIAGFDYTMWRFSITQPIEPSRNDELYTVPINIISGTPKIVKDGRESQVVLGCYSVTQGGNFEITPEFDCLFAWPVLRD